MGLTRNSNSRFAISRLRLRPRFGGQGFRRVETGRWKLEYDREVRSAEMGMAADGRGQVELSLNRTTHVSILVTTCQDRMRHPANVNNSL